MKRLLLLVVLIVIGCGGESPTEPFEVPFNVDVTFTSSYQDAGKICTFTLRAKANRPTTVVTYEWELRGQNGGNSTGSSFFVDRDSGLFTDELVEVFTASRGSNLSIMRQLEILMSAPPNFSKRVSMGPSCP